MKPLTIGIITGAGPEAGLDLWKKIIKYNKTYYTDYKGDINANHVVIHSVPELATAMNIEDNEDNLWEILKQTILKIDNHVDLFCIACNILHYYEPKIKNLNLKSEFVSIVNETKKYLISNNFTDIALLSIPKIIELKKYSPYTSLKENATIEVPDKNEINELIKNIKINGANNKTSKNKFNEIMLKTNSKNIVLACTELPLLDTKGYTKNFIDPTQILARSIVNNANKKLL